MIITENERDTKFLGFARLLYQELSDLSSETIIHENLNERERQEQLLVIAQRAYDLARHVILHEDVPRNIQVEPDDYLKAIPDLTQWPESPK